MTTHMLGRVRLWVQVQLANDRTHEIMEEAEAVLSQSSTGYNPVELTVLLHLNVSLRIQVLALSECAEVGFVAWE